MVRPGQGSGLEGKAGGRLAITELKEELPAHRREFSPALAMISA